MPDLSSIHTVLILARCSTGEWGAAGAEEEQGLRSKLGIAGLGAKIKSYIQIGGSGTEEKSSSDTDEVSTIENMEGSAREASGLEGERGRLYLTLPLHTILVRGVMTGTG